MNDTIEQDYNVFLKQLTHEGCFDGDDMETTYHDTLYSGIGYELKCKTHWEDDAFISALNVYIQGRETGIFRKWNKAGNLVCEGLVYMDQSNGYNREWDDKGNLFRQQIILKGIRIYIKKRKQSSKDCFDEIRDERGFEGYVNRVRRAGSARLNRMHYSPQVEFRFQDTYYMFEIDKMILQYVQEERTDIKGLLDQVIVFTDEWLARKDQKYRQYKKSMPIAEFSSKTEDALVWDACYSDDMEYSIVNTLSECQQGHKSGLELQWQLNSDKNLQTLKSIKEYVEGNEIMRQYFND